MVNNKVLGWFILILVEPPAFGQWLNWFYSLSN